MAFAIPEHLPRATKAKQPDISTSILAKIADTKVITIQNAASWVAELEAAVVTTKVSP